MLLSATCLRKNLPTSFLRASKRRAAFSVLPAVVRVAALVVGMVGCLVVLKGGVVGRLVVGRAVLKLGVVLSPTETNMENTSAIPTTRFG